MIDPKEQYVRIESWGSVMLPLKHVHLLEHAAIVDTAYVDGRNMVKLQKDGAIKFVMVPKEEVVAALAAHRLEK
jgi:hypothetical protein